VVAGAASIVLARPVYEVFANSPEYFVVRRSSAGQVVTFGIGLMMPGLVAGLAVALIGTGSVRRRRLAASVADGAIAGVLVLQIGVGLGFTAIPTYVVAAGLAVLTTSVKRLRSAGFIPGLIRAA
jgi:uncharacterized membrane protein YqgA involved in biofilm formation